MSILDIVPYWLPDLRFSNSNDIFSFYPKFSITTFRQVPNCKTIGIDGNILAVHPQGGKKVITVLLTIQVEDRQQYYQLWFKEKRKESYFNK